MENYGLFCLGKEACVFLGFALAQTMKVITPSPNPVAEIPALEVPVAEVPVAEIPVAEIPVAEIPVAEIEPDYDSGEEVHEHVENNELSVHAKSLIKTGDGQGVKKFTYNSTKFNGHLPTSELDSFLNIIKTVKGETTVLHLISVLNRVAENFPDDHIPSVGSLKTKTNGILTELARLFRGTATEAEVDEFKLKALGKLEWHTKASFVEKIAFCNELKHVVEDEPEVRKWFFLRFRPWDCKPGPFDPSRAIWFQERLDILVTSLEKQKARSAKRQKQSKSHV